MTTQGEESLLKNAKRIKAWIVESIRGPAIVKLTKIVPGFVTADAQPVVKVRAPNGRTTPAGPTPGAPVVVWGTGGFELSACIDPEDTALSLPLESDHAGFYRTGQLADPASPRVHDRGLAVSLPFSTRKSAAAGAGEVYLGHPGKSLHVKINREQFEVEIEAGGITGRIKIGKGATRGAARDGDTVAKTALMQTWMSQVTAACNGGVGPGAVAAHVAAALGTISSASSKVVIE